MPNTDELQRIRKQLENEISECLATIGAEVARCGLLTQSYYDLIDKHFGPAAYTHYPRQPQQNDGESDSDIGVYRERGGG